MLVHFGADLLEPEWASASVCVGLFDGVHAGHQALIRRTIQAGEQREHPSVILTFDRHPSAVLSPAKRPHSIGTLEQNVRCFREMGAGLAVILPFNQATAETEAETFLDEILVRRLRANHLVVGHDFALGRGRKGTAEWLSQRIETEIIHPVQHGGRRVSSTDIRALIGRGHVEEAAMLLTRPFALAGIVVGGQKLGRKLGWPTINLARAADQLVPSDGVYAGIARTPFGFFRAAISIGMRPAVNGSQRTIEAHLLDYPGDSLYGRPVELQFHVRLRAELDFPTLEALSEQVRRDIDETRLRVAL